jgi:hypothetical protein
MDLFLEPQLREFVAVLAVFSFSPLASEGVNVLANGCHGDSYRRLNFAMDLSNWKPGAFSDVEDPELIKTGLLCGGAAID